MNDLANRRNNFIQRAKEKHNDKYNYSKINYINTSIKVEIICPIHGSFYQTPNSHLNGAGCPECGKLSAINNLSISKSEFISRSNKIHDFKYDYSKICYVNSQTKIEIICPLHGGYYQTPQIHLQKHGCPKCAAEGRKNNLKKSNEQWIIDFKRTHNNKYDYKIIDDKIVIICPLHGEFEQNYYSHAYGYGCKKCGITKSQTSSLSDTKQFVGKAQKLHKYKYNYSKVNYHKSKDKIIIICPKHGEFEQRPNSHLNNQGCPSCGTVISKHHQSIIDIIPKDQHVVINDRTVLNGLEIDILINDKIGIEIHGCYWHGLRRNNQKDYLTLKNRHKFKADLANLNNIKLFQFWDFEIENKKYLIQSMIYNSMSLSKSIYARKCKIVKLNNNIASSFFNKSHLQGHRNASIIYGLELNNELQCALSFSKHPKFDWEIIRFANKLNHNVIGGFSRLLKHFISENNPKQILTFADRRISTGNLYIKNKFEHIGNTEPNYFYWKHNTILSRQQCQKNKLHKFLELYDDKLSETENMLNNNYVKVYDAGHAKSLLKL